MPICVGRYWPASDTPFKWRFAGIPMMGNGQKPTGTKAH